MVKTSPDYARVSLAAAMTLGLKKGRFYRGAKLHCINLLLSYQEGCKANCAYCGLQKKREGEYEDKSFIRVEWPIYSIDEIIENSNNNAGIHRFCISMVTHRQAMEDTIQIVKKIRSSLVDVPVSVLVSPSIMAKKDLENLKESGADKVGIAIDCGNRDLFDKLRGDGVSGPHKWEKYWEVYKDSIDVFGRGMAGVHLVVGLGESEREMLELIQRSKDMGGNTHLFSFFPEAGTKMGKHPQADSGQYRRIQMGRYIIDNDLGTYNNFIFENDKLTSYGIYNQLYSDILNQGKAFMTCGCTGKNGEVACNRPYGDSMPGDDIRSYPFTPGKDDIDIINKQLKTY